MTDSELREINEIKDSLKEINKKLDTYHEATLTLHTVVLGKNGDVGLVGKIADLTRFQGRCLIVFGVLIGSGVLGGSAWGIAQWIG